MATIDKLDINIYIQYARRTQLIEQINQEYRLTEASSIPPQTQMIDYFPRPSEIDMLLGISQTQNPWAYFFPPKSFRSTRRSPFAFSRIIAIGNSTEEEEKEEEKLKNIPCSTADEEEEKNVLIDCLAQVRKINGWMGFIIGRVGQFLQG